MKDHIALKRRYLQKVSAWPCIPHALSARSKKHLPRKRFTYGERKRGVKDEKDGGKLPPNYAGNYCLFM
jgi:hypothetical protein